MTEETKNKLYEAWAYCDWKDKSTEFMISYMAREADCKYHEVIDFLMLSPEEDRQKWYKDNPDWTDKYKQ